MVCYFEKVSGNPQRGWWRLRNRFSKSIVVEPVQLCRYMWTNVWKGTLCWKMILMQRLRLIWPPFCHFVQEVNELWYLRWVKIALPIIPNIINFLHTSAEWRAIKCKRLIKIILPESVPLRKVGHMCIILSVYVIQCSWLDL